MKTTDGPGFEYLTPEERLSRADSENGTWASYPGGEALEFEDNANRKAAELGGEIDWTVVALDKFIQRAYAEENSWAKVREFAEAAIAQYEALFEGQHPDLIGLTSDELSELALEFTDGDVAAFVAKYAYFKDCFAEAEREADLMASDETRVAGPYECARCGNDLRDDFSVDPPDDKQAPAQIDVIRQRYDCWMHIHDLGLSSCSYCRHVAEKDD